MFTNDFDLLNEKIHQSFTILKDFIPQVITQQVENTVYSRALINYTQAIKNQSNQTTETLTPSEKLRRVNRILITSFCKRGYGYDFLQYQVQQPKKQIGILQMEYDENLNRIIRDSFKKLQEFLIKQKLIAKKSNKTDLHQIYLKAIKYRISLPPQIWLIFLNMLKGLYRVQPYNAVTRQQAYILYQTFKRIIKSPSKYKKNSQQKDKINKNKSITTVKIQDKSQQNKSVKLQQGQNKQRYQKFQLHKHWNSNYQQLFLQLYRRSPNISKIRDRFQLVYRNDSELFTVPALRSKLFKIIRVAIKQIFNYISMHGSNKLPPLIRLSDDRIKMIINNQQFRKIRLLILEIYTKGYDAKLLSQVINQINLYITEEQKKINSKTNVNKSSKNGDHYQRYEKIPEFYHPKYEKGKKIKLHREVHTLKGIIGQKFQKDKFIRVEDEGHQDGNYIPHWDNESVYNIQE